jgi:hypothetical protein
MKLNDLNKIDALSPKVGEKNFSDWVRRSFYCRNHGLSSANCQPVASVLLVAAAMIVYGAKYYAADVANNVGPAVGSRGFNFAAIIIAAPLSQLVR